MSSLDINNQKVDKLDEPNDNQKHFVTFAKMNKYFLFPFLCPIFCMLANYFSNKIIFSKAKISDYFLLTYVEFTYVVGGLIYFISYSKKTNNDLDDSYSKRLKLLKKYKKEVKKDIKKKWLIILAISVLTIIYIVSVGLYRDRHLFEPRLYFLLFIPFFTKFILKEEIYKHQYLSLIITIFAIILLIIPVCLVFEVEDIVPNIINLIGGVSYSLMLILIKYIMLTYYMPPLLICLLIGVISAIITFIGFFVFSLINYHDLSYFIDLLDFSEAENKTTLIIYLILGFLLFSALNVFTFLVIFYFSPILLLVTDIISPMLQWVVATIENGPIMPDAVFNPIGYCITLLSSLIYNEIIILNFCGLNENTKKFVQYRQTEESIELTKAENEIKLEDSKNEDDNDYD